MLLECIVMDLCAFIVVAPCAQSVRFVLKKQYKYIIIKEDYYE